MARQRAMRAPRVGNGAMHNVQYQFEVNRCRNEEVNVNFDTLIWRQHWVTHQIKMQPSDMFIRVQPTDMLIRSATYILVYQRTCLSECNLHTVMFIRVQPT
ncbi:hypothetical protein DPMN_145514 [Dreissena polymorpha]|uniref:Uncharacterized protein n=1 Tax=Dreissena polymorpha TaxID=45954 RepID=A0A9D4F468_DREPO|nr:hypothetical protein DPMN_145514 [Dreissena polymorpha]